MRCGFYYWFAWVVGFSVLLSGAAFAAPLTAPPPPPPPAPPVAPVTAPAPVPPTIRPPAALPVAPAPIRPPFALPAGPVVSPTPCVVTYKYTGVMNEVIGKIITDRLIRQGVSVAQSTATKAAVARGLTAGAARVGVGLFAPVSWPALLLSVGLPAFTDYGIPLIKDALIKWRFSNNRVISETSDTMFYNPQYHDFIGSCYGIHRNRCDCPIRSILLPESVVNAYLATYPGGHKSPYESATFWRRSISELSELSESSDFRYLGLFANADDAAAHLPEIMLGQKLSSEMLTVAVNTAWRAANIDSSFTSNTLAWSASDPITREEVEEWLKENDSSAPTVRDFVSAVAFEGVEGVSLAKIEAVPVNQGANVSAAPSSNVPSSNQGANVSAAPSSNQGENVTAARSSKVRFSNQGANVSAVPSSNAPSSNQAKNVPVAPSSNQAKNIPVAPSFDQASVPSSNQTANVPAEESSFNQSADVPASSSFSNQTAEQSSQQAAHAPTTRSAENSANSAEDGENNSEAGENNPNGGDEDNASEDEPDLVDPLLEPIPEAWSILQPLLDLMPDLKDFKVPPHQSICPVANFCAFGKEYSINSHCQLIEQNRFVIESACSVVWALVALYIFLRA